MKEINSNNPRADMVDMCRRLARTTQRRESGVTAHEVVDDRVEGAVEVGQPMGNEGLDR